MPRWHDASALRAFVVRSPASGGRCVSASLARGVRARRHVGVASLYAESMTAPRSLSDRTRAAVAALREVADILGHSPSVKEYRSVRERLPELGLPPEGNVRRWLGGGWNDCLTRALLDAVAETDSPSRPIGKNDYYEDEQVLSALRECATDLASIHRFSVGRRLGRRPK